MKELEVKILNIDLKEMENKLISLGAILVGKEKQINTLIDSEDNYIENKLDSYLRIREAHHILENKSDITFTMKKNINREGIRENLEINIEISDKDSMIYILNDLGYKVKEEGFKERTSYIFKDARFDLDVWDDKTYPDAYMEIEVKTKEQLDEIIEFLQIPKENISTKSILELRREKNLL